MIDLNLIKSANNKKVLLYSGGMDSYIISKLEDFDTLLYVDSKSKYSSIEIEFLKKHNLKNLVIDDRLSLADVEYESAIVPLRNLFFVMIGSYYGDEIVLGATQGDRSTDKDFFFADKTSELLKHIYGTSWWCEGRNINVNLKYKSWTKKDLIDAYMKRGFSIDELQEKSFSCYTPIDGHNCGMCKPCVRKWITLLPYIDEKDRAEYLKRKERLYWDENIEKIREHLDNPILTRGAEDIQTIEIYDKYIKGK